MNEKYRAIVDDEHTFEWDEQVLEEVKIEHVSGNKYHMLWQEQSLYIELWHADFDKKRIEVIVRGRLHKVRLEDRFDQLVEKMGLTSALGQQIKEIRAPMPGLILNVLVKSGQEIAADSHVVVLEAMKMENIISTPTDAKVQEVLVEKGQAVEKGQVLIKLD